MNNTNFGHTFQVFPEVNRAYVYFDGPWDEPNITDKPNDPRKRVSNQVLLAKMQEAYRLSGWENQLVLTYSHPEILASKMNAYFLPSYQGIRYGPEDLFQAVVHHDTGDIGTYSWITGTVMPPTRMTPTLTLPIARDVICRAVTELAGITRYEEYLDPVQLGI